MIIQEMIAEQSVFQNCLSADRSENKNDKNRANRTWPQPRRGKMKAVRKFPELFEVVGICEQDEKWLAKRRNLDVYKDLPLLSFDELLDKVDAVLVECDVADLTKTAQKCINAGRHIHLDKPASGTFSEYRKLLQTAQEKQLVVQLGYMYRYNPAIKKCMEMIQKGNWGNLSDQRRNEYISLS